MQLNDFLPIRGDALQIGVSDRLSLKTGFGQLKRSKFSSSCSKNESGWSPPGNIGSKLLQSFIFKIYIYWINMKHDFLHKSHTTIHRDYFRCTILLNRVFIGDWNFHSSLLGLWVLQVWYTMSWKYLFSWHVHMRIWICNQTIERQTAVRKIRNIAVHQQHVTTTKCGK